MSILHQRRMFWITCGLSVLTVVVALVMYALRQNIHLFYTPSQIFAHEAPLGVRIRLGGMVEKDSLKREIKENDAQKIAVQFVVSDTMHRITVCYNGILPDLFREGQGIVALGRLDQKGIFIADEVLAKHDENYMPPEVAATMK